MDEYKLLDFTKKEIAPLVLGRFEQAGLSISEAGAAAHYLKEELDAAVARSAGCSDFNFRKLDE